MRRMHRGDLSAPVLAIIVTVGVIAAGLVLMAWFWWFAPQAGKAGSLQVLGQPAIVEADGNWTTYINVRNTGNADISISKVVVKGIECNMTSTVSLGPGQSDVIIANCSKSVVSIGTDEYSVQAVITTDYGIYTAGLIVIRR